ncbi:MAG: hypothetical protein WAO02_13365 [Verrucomicrobiia bacterium]
MEIQRQRLAPVFGTLFAGLILAGTALVWIPSCLPAAEPVASASATTNSPTATRYGLLDGLDHRSSYDQDVFPEPFLVDDSALEENEARLDWLHVEANARQSDTVTAEVEKGFGQMTLEIEVPYQCSAAAGESTERGMGNINWGARYPLYEFVAANGSFDTAFGTAMEVGVPVNSAVSRYTELVPKIFNDLRFGEHFTLQSVFGYSTLFGGGDDGGLQTFESGFVFGYTIQHQELPLPGVLQFIPMFELVGDTWMNKGDSGQTSLSGNACFRANLKAIGSVQPRLGLGFVFPMDNNARTDVHWGIVTSLVFEY